MTAKRDRIRPIRWLEPSCSYMLIDENWVSIRVHNDKAGWYRRALVRLLLKLHPLRPQLALEFADIGE